MVEGEDTALVEGIVESICGAISEINTNARL
jgi:hypothetical protein